MAKQSRRYDTPLYCGAWLSQKPAETPAGKVATPPAGEAAETPAGEDEKMSAATQTQAGYILLGGGGGSGHHGIRNRLIVAAYDDEAGELKEELSSLPTGDEAPAGLAVHPKGDGVVVAIAEGVRHYDLDLNKGQMAPSDQSMKPLDIVGELKCLAFSEDGGWLATGGENGNVSLFRWPGLDKVAAADGAYKDGVKDLHFSEDGHFLAVTGSGGPCRVFDVDVEAGVDHQLSQTAALTDEDKRGRMGFCRFGRSSSTTMALFTSVARGGEGHIIQWDASTGCPVHHRRVHSDPISALAISRDGHRLATGHPEGAVTVLDSLTLARLVEVRRAHMVFVTALDFSPDCRTLLSVSADSSARCTRVPQMSSSGANRWPLAIALLILVLAILVALLQHREGSD